MAAGPASCRRDGRCLRAGRIALSAGPRASTRNPRHSTPPRRPSPAPNPAPRQVRYDGRHFVGPNWPISWLRPQSARTASITAGLRPAGPPPLPGSRPLVWRRRLAEIDREIEALLDAHEVGKLLLGIEGQGPHSAARIVAAVGDPARFRSAGAFPAYVRVVPGLRQSGKQSGRSRASITPMGNARMRRALWMPVLGAIRRNPWLGAFYERLRAAESRPSSRSWQPCASCSTPFTPSPKKNPNRSSSRPGRRGRRRAQRR